MRRDSVRVCPSGVMRKMKAKLLCLSAALGTLVTSAFGYGVYGEKTVYEWDLQELRSASNNTSADIRLVSYAPQMPAPALRLQTTSPDDILYLRSEDWGSAKLLAFDAYYDCDNSASIILKVYAKGEQSERLYCNIGVLPRLNTRITVPLSLLSGQQIFMDRNPGRLKGVAFGKRTNLEEIDRVTIGVKVTGYETKERLYVNNIAILSENPEFKLPEVKMVDAMGQNAQRDWVGKTPDIPTLKRQLNDALESAKKVTTPEGFSKYGGTTQKRFDASGFFRVEKSDNIWWLVDPEGYAFYSTGLDVVNPGESTYLVPGMEGLYEWLPEPVGSFAEARYTDWQGKTYVNFARANLIRAFGGDWYDKWRTMTKGRMTEWGFNTIGNWSDVNEFRGHQIPYVLPLGGFPYAKKNLFRDFPDVFDPEYTVQSQKFAKGLEAYKDDPWLIGYFMRNEPEWGFGKFNLASEMLEANPGTHSRKALADFLAKKYDTAEVLSKAWNLSGENALTDFQDLVSKNFSRMENKSKAAEEDLWAFSGELVKRYIEVPVTELRKIDPNHLNLGMRYAWISSDLLYKAGEMFDVFTLNCYAMTPDFDAINTIAQKCNKPTMIGEFHFGALDRGMTATGLKAVRTQKDRGLAYRYYVEQGAANPNFLGAHYFILNDQSLLGRFDGENYQIGLVDVAQTPYYDMVEEVTKANRNVYDVRLGNKKPYDKQPESLPTISF